MIRYGWLAILAAALLVWNGTAQAVGVRYNPKSGDKFSLIGVEGTIEHGDALGLKAVLEEAKLRGLPIIVTLIGEGSIASEAMKIGQVLRDFDVMTKAGNCKGTCVLAFLGGKNRFYPRTDSGGALIVYRPENIDMMLPKDGSTQILLSPQGELKEIYDYIIKMTNLPDFYYMFVNASYTNPYTLLGHEAKQMNVVTYLPK